MFITNYLNFSKIDLISIIIDLLPTLSEGKAQQYRSEARTKGARVAYDIL